MIWITIAVMGYLAIGLLLMDYMCPCWHPFEKLIGAVIWPVSAAIGIYFMVKEVRRPEIDWNAYLALIVLASALEMNKKETMLESHKSPKPWLVWAYDPCPEGGWHIDQGYDTREEAEAAAKVYHETQVTSHLERVDKYKKEGRNITWNFSCYGGVMVTPGQVFELDVDLSPEED